jgi:hypothetical protein
MIETSDFFFLNIFAKGISGRKRFRKALTVFRDV